jgi:hypothetical protein
MKLMELYQNKIMGAIRGLDRIRFRGTLRWLANERGLKTFMSRYHILLKDFSSWANGLTSSIRKSFEARAADRDIEMRYLRSGAIDKEKLARQIAESKRIAEGSICTFSVVEPCISARVKGNRSSKKLELSMVPRKCVWLYHYFNDSELGFGHVRLQSWVPFNVFICLNGRHVLERQLQKHGIGYVKDGNCFPWIEDVFAAQSLMDQQLQVNWPGLLNRLTFEMCPDLCKFLPFVPDYYWSADETEWATDIMFKSARYLDRLYPSLLHHGMRVSDSASIMQYLGRRNISSSGRIKGRRPQEVMTDYRKFYEGIRVKHWLNRNSVKLYNKGGSILRIETTINNTRDFKVFRHPDDDKSRGASWQKMRKGVSDLHRRCQVSDKCNERYGDALASVEVNEKLREVLSPVCNKIHRNGKTYRGLNLWHEGDYKLLSFLSRGEHALCGFRNKDLRKYLYSGWAKWSKEDRKRYSGRTTRRIKLLRVHGLIKKVSRENRYIVTAKGQKLAGALMSASAVDIKGLTKIAA